MFEDFLSIAVLILSVINGLILVYNFKRDKPRLVVLPLQPKVYQCWVRLSDSGEAGNVVRRYAFLSYFSVANSGLRDVSVNKWRLKIGNRLGLVQFDKKNVELPPSNIPEFQCQIGDEHVKIIKIFGQNTQNVQNSSNMVKSGDSVSGMACWIYPVLEDSKLDIQIDDDENVYGELVIGSVLGQKSKCEIVFYKNTIDVLKTTMPTIGSYLEKI